MNNDAKHFVDQEALVADRVSPKGSADASSMLSFFFSRMDKATASDGELAWLSGATEDIQLMASNLSKTVAGIGGLIAYEHDNEGIKSGCLQSPADLPNLLFGVADTLATIEQMAFIAGEADYALRERYKSRAEKLEQVVANPRVTR